MHVYKITNIKNGKIYIGKTIKNNILLRLREHIRFSKIKDNMLLYRAIRKYGEENFKIESIFKGKTNNEIILKEIEFIKSLNSTNPKIGYNILEGGEGVHPTVAMRLKLSERGKKLIGSKNPFYGKHHSEEQKRKWSKERKGISYSGWKHSEETKKKLSEIRSNCSKETREKLSNNCKKRVGEKAIRNREIICLELERKFFSAQSASEILTKEFDKKFTRRAIGSVCRGEKKTHNNLTFAFVDGLIKKNKVTYKKETILVVELNKKFFSKKQCSEYLTILESEKYWDKYMIHNKKYKKYTFIIL